MVHYILRRVIILLITLVLVSFAIFSLALLSCAWFWFHALQHTRSLTPKQAAITVLVPVVLLLGVMLASRIMSGWA